MPPEPRPWFARPGVILAVAFALRFGTVLPALHTQPYSDEAAYHGLAERLAAGRGFCFEDGSLTSWRPPLWPAVLAGLYTVTGPSPAAGRLLEVALGILLVGLILLLARAAEPEQPRVPVVAGWWAALSPTLIFYSHSLFSETLYGLTLGLALLSLLRARETAGRRWTVVAGVALGLSCLTRGATVLLVPPALVWFAFAHTERRVGLRRAGLAAVCCALCVAPWTWRNYLVHGGLILVDSNGAVNLFYGNHPDTPRLRPWEVVELPHVPQPAVPSGAGEIALQRRALYEAALFVANKPGRFLLGLVIKTGNLWGLARDLPSGVAAGLYGRAGTPVLALVAGLAGLEGLALLCLGVLGIALSERRAAPELALLVAAWLTLVHAVSYGHSRYRFGALLLLYGLAAQWIVAKPDWRERWSRLPTARRRVADLAVALLCLNFAYEVVVLELMPRLAR
ncbi:MAG: glycosyltransferase family 39 protein [Armatimonadetes bacterium]|nr:glycosyltransferase family 39 protein [Armatimonadota bacterium]